MKNEYRPRVRFMKFKDEWKLLSMKNFINNMYGGASITPSDYQNDGVPTVPKSAINSSGIADLSNSKFVSDDYCQKNLNSCVYSGDFVTSLRDLVPTAPNMGRVVKLIGESKRYLMPQGVYRLLLEKNIDENFLIAFSNSDKFRNSILKIKTGSTQVHIRNSQYLGIEIIAPSHEEQMKIGNFFKSLDDTISLHQQELEALKQTKQGFLQKMFPKDGENVPQIRFNEFSEPWTQIEFGKVIKLVGGATPLKENKEYWNGDIVWLSSQEIKNKYVSKGTYLITEQAVKDNRTKVVSEGTPLIVTRSGILAKRFPISISLNEVAINQDIKALIFDRERFDTEFIVAEIKSKELYILNNIVKTGTTVQSVNLPDLNRMNLHIPEYAEQLKIGKFFRELDEVIDLKEKELEALKETKKGFLQKMFV